MQKVRDNLIVLRQDLPEYVRTQHEPSIVPLENLNSISVDELEKLILSCPIKCFKLDAIPMELLKETLPSTHGLVRDTINTSLTEGHFPDDLKEVAAKPLLKQANLDLLEKNYRPVSNLPFLSRAIEKAAASQLVLHIEE